MEGFSQCFGVGNADEDSRVWGGVAVVLGEQRWKGAVLPGFRVLTWTLVDKVTPSRGVGWDKVTRRGSTLWLVLVCCTQGRGWLM